MRRVLAALPAKLAHLQPVRRCLPVLRRGVVLVFAISTLQLNDFAGHCWLTPFVFAWLSPGLVRVEARISKIALRS